MKLIKEAANARTVQNENKNYTFHLGKVAPQRPHRAFLSSFPPFCILIPAKQHKGIKKQQNYTNLSLFCLSLFNMHKIVRLFASHDIRSATRRRSDKTKEKAIQFFCICTFSCFA
jgi:hypothetical protein